MIRLLRSSSPSNRRACPASIPARLAATGTVTSGPGATPSSRNNPAAAGPSAWYDQDSTVRRSVPGLSPGQRVPRRAGELTRQRGQWRAPVDRRGQAEGERRPGAPLDDGGHRVRFGRHPVRPHLPGQHLARLGRTRQLERDRPGAVGDQPGQPAAAGHHDQAPRRTGQQRPYLRAVVGVVQYHQDPPAGQQAAVHRGPRVQSGRDPRDRYAERVQEPVDHVGRRHRRLLRMEAAQVHA